MTVDPPVRINGHAHICRCSIFWEDRQKIDVCLNLVDNPDQPLCTSCERDHATGRSLEPGSRFVLRPITTKEPRP